MRTKPLLWASVCLLLSGAFRALDAAPETEDEEDADGTGPVSLKVVPAHPVCTYPKVTGPCKAAFPRWFFNTRSGRCETFVYGGCRGNENRFGSLEECRRRCLPDDTKAQTRKNGPVSLKVVPAHPVCTYPKVTGPCKAAFSQWFFNTQSGRCETFVYGGCRGNENRFDSLEECRRRCLPGSRLQEAADLRVRRPGRPGFCSLEAQVGFCRAYFTRFFYNHRAQRCEKFVFGGCGGNPNNFETEAQCQKACGTPEHGSPAPGPSTPRPSTPRPAKKNAGTWEFSVPSWCLTRVDRGLCSANETRFYYEPDAGACLPFSYSGCGGNENNFLSERACLKACKKAFFKRPPKQRLTPTKKRKPSVEIGYEIY